MSRGQRSVQERITVAAGIGVKTCSGIEQGRRCRTGRKNLDILRSAKSQVGCL